MEELLIGAIAKRCGVSVEAIRFYEKRGLIPVRRRSDGRIRYFTAAAVGRILFIKQAQQLGFTLEEIKSLLPEHGGSGKVARALAEERLHAIDQRMRELAVTRRLLNAFIAELAQESL